MVKLKIGTSFYFVAARDQFLLTVPRRDAPKSGEPIMLWVPNQWTCYVSAWIKIFRPSLTKNMKTPSSHLWLNQDGSPRKNLNGIVDSVRKRYRYLHVSRRIVRSCMTWSVPTVSWHQTGCCLHAFPRCWLLRVACSCVLPRAGMSPTRP